MSSDRSTAATSVLCVVVPVGAGAGAGAGDGVCIDLVRLFTSITCCLHQFFYMFRRRIDMFCLGVYCCLDRNCEASNAIKRNF